MLEVKRLQVPRHVYIEKAHLNVFILILNTLRYWKDFMISNIGNTRI